MLYHPYISKVLLSLFCFLYIFSVSIAAQQPGVLTGQVTDELGNVVNNADVFITDKTGKTINTSTDKTGKYIFRSLTSGSYALKVTSADFDLFEASEIAVVGGKMQSFDVQLKIKPINASVSVDPATNSSSEPTNNFAETVLREKEIDELPEDAEALAAALKAMSVMGPGEPQIFVDGFESSQPPPKQTIREVRISQNNFSAEDDRPGGSRIQIFTKSGLDKLQGGAFFNFSGDKLNARNPFAAERAPYSYRQYGGSLSGTLIPKKGSFFVSFQKLDENQNGIVTAQTLDSALNVVPLNLSFIIPRRNLSFNPRVDFQLNEKHSLAIRYSFSRSKINNIGVGELSLPERSYNYQILQHVIQATETAVINSQTVNETRFQFIRSELNLSDDNPAPGIVVPGAFFGGSSGVGLKANQANRFEFQNYTTTNTRSHLFRFGIKFRGVNISDESTGNFNGTFTFAGGQAPLLDSNYQIILDGNGQPVLTQITSLERYRRTLLLQRNGFSPAEIRLRGGGATQFSIERGETGAHVRQFDFGVFFQDEWRVKPNFNLYLGLRYEGQTNIGDKTNFAPRVAFAWVPKIGKNQNTTIRGGVGLYFDRFDETYTLQADLFDGLSRQRVISSDPALVDFFPNAPSSTVLSGFFDRQSITKIAGDLQSARSVVSLINFEHKLSPKSSFYAGLSTYRTWHSIRQRNINAPLPGTYIAGQSASGTRPFGDTGEIFLVESSNGYFQNQFYAGVRTQINPAIYFSGSYLLSDTKDGGSVGSFPADSYNVKSDWGRSAAFSIRHRLYLNGRFEVPRLKITLTPQVILFSSRPFNITTGLDTNGDQIYEDRPSIATALSGAGIYNTPFGAFNIRPSEGEEIIARNIGRGPAFFSVNLGISRTFNFGLFEKEKASKNYSPPYKLIFSLQVQNLLNKVNLGTPIGNLSSPLFGLSTRSVGAYGFEDGSPAYNRRIEAQIRFSF